MLKLGSFYQPLLAPIHCRPGYRWLLLQGYASGLISQGLSLLGGGISGLGG